MPKLSQMTPAFDKIKPGLIRDFKHYHEQSWKIVQPLFDTPEGREQLFPRGAGRGRNRVTNALSTVVRYCNRSASRYATDADRAKLPPDLDWAKMDADAIKYADDQVAAFVYKLLRKVGDLNNANVLDADASRFEFRIIGELQGHKISVSQNRVLNCSPLGTLYHQWPAKIYVDGKFTPEAAYKGLMKIAPEEKAPPAPTKMDLEWIVSKGQRDIEKERDRMWQSKRTDDHSAHLVNYSAAELWAKKAEPAFINAMRDAVAQTLGVEIPGKASKAGIMRAISAAIVTGPASKIDKAKTAIELEKAMKAVPAF